LIIQVVIYKTTLDRRKWTTSLDQNIWDWHLTTDRVRHGVTSSQPTTLSTSTVPSVKMWNSRSLTLFQLFLSLLSLTNAVSWNGRCGYETQSHCDVNVSLVCDAATSTCQCSSGTLTTNVSYILNWDAGQGLCVGQRNSACVGTRQHAVAEGWKAIPCKEDLTCVQLRDMPSGVGSCQSKLFLHGLSCNENVFCDSSRGLICTDGLCACAKERERTSPKFALEWDADMNNCVAPIGTSCIGTKDSSHPLAPGHKDILCVLEADCVQVPGQTPGVGICQSRMANGASGLLNPTSTFQFLTMAITGMAMVVVNHF